MSRTLLISAIVLLLAQPALALLISEPGNKPQPEANYTDWPGVINAVNDPSRVMLVWVNGNEQLMYAGTADDLNRVIGKFAATNVPKLELRLLPANADLKSVKEGPQFIVKYDWSIELNGGVAKAFAVAQELDPVMPLHPVLTVYVSDRIDLQQLNIPQNLIIAQRDDRKTQLQEAMKSDNVARRNHAESLWKALEPELEPDQRLIYEKRTAQISAWVSSRKTTE